MELRFEVVLFRIYVSRAQDKTKQYYYWFVFSLFYSIMRFKENLRDSCDIGFRVQFNAEFTSQVMNFPLEFGFFILFMLIAD